MGKKTKKKLAPSKRSAASSSSKSSVVTTSFSQDPARSYTLALWTDLPHGDRYRPAQGVIYINPETREYVWRDTTGQTYEGQIPNTIDLDNLPEKLADPDFVASILAPVFPKSTRHLDEFPETTTNPVEFTFNLHQQELGQHQGTGAAAAYAKKLRDGYERVTAETASPSSSSFASSAQSSTTALNSSNNRKKTVSLNEKRDTFRKNSILGAVVN